MSMGLNSQMKLANAIRYLRERDRYVLDRPVEKRDVRPPILTAFKRDMQAQRNR